MIFEEQLSRKPDHFPWATTAMETMWHNPWTASKFTFASDAQDLRVNMDEKMKGMVIRSISSISQVEVQVKRFWVRLGDTLPHPSLIGLGIVMGNIEVIHEQAYGKALDVLGLESIYEENLKIPVVANRVKYLQKHLKKRYVDARQQFLYSLILFTLYIENVSLFSQFYTINYVNREHNMCKDLAQQVLYTAKEEAVHALCGMKIVKEIKKYHPELFTDELIDTIRAQCLKAFIAESAIIEWQVGDYESDLVSVPILQEFLKNRFNQSLEMIDIPVVFENLDEDLLGKTNWFDEEINATIKTDFFYQDETGYSKNDRSFDPDDLF